MNQSGQIREFRWPTTVLQILQIFKGVSVYKGRLLKPGIAACAHKRGTFLIYNFTNR